MPILWHQLLAKTLHELLHPVGIQVLTEVPVVPEPPQADILLLRRKEDTWTPRQRALLPDGLRDIRAGHVLLEFKFTESLNEEAIYQTFLYDRLYLQTNRLSRDALQSALISSKTPATDILERFGFQQNRTPGVYLSQNPWTSTLRIILLNELADTPGNAPIKCFASRMEERKKAFETIRQAKLFRLSIGFGRTMTNIWRLLMNNAAQDHWNLEELTLDGVQELGKEWIEFLLDAIPAEELLLRPKAAEIIKKNLLDSHKKGWDEGQREGFLSGQIRLLQLQLEQKFGPLPAGMQEQLEKADMDKMAQWSSRILHAKKIEEIFN